MPGPIVVLGLLGAVVVGASTVAAFRRWRPAKEDVLRDYVTVVLPRLEELYGAADGYAVAGVDRALQGTGVSTRFRFHAYALFCSRADFMRHAAWTRLDYDRLRAQMLLVHRRYAERPWGGGTV